MKIGLCLVFFNAILMGAITASNVPTIKAEKSYVVLVTNETAKDQGWMKVVTALRNKHDASLVLYPRSNVKSVLKALKKINPRFAAFVGQPGEIGRDFVVDVSRLTRKLDDDPYTDLRWSIITGHDSQDALRIAKYDKPLIVDSAASSMGPGIFKSLEHGFSSYETNPNKFSIKRKGEGNTENVQCEKDPVVNLVNAFNQQGPSLWETSGHATERDWMIGYGVKAGFFKCEDGKLYGLTTTNKKHYINSPTPKIYMPVGCCLIGHIPDKNSMAIAWMHSGGVYQMFGYTAVTFHGFMGWGMRDYMANSYTLNESFYFNNQALIWELQKEFPEKAHIEFDDYDQKKINLIPKKYKIKDKKLMGHLWDRDVVAFYGDPAWEARRNSKSPAWESKFSHVGEQVTIEIVVLKDGKWSGRPLGIPFPQRLKRIRLIECSDEIKPLVTNDFALIPLKGKKRNKGDMIKLQFGAYAEDSKLTSANDKPIVIEQTIQSEPVQLKAFFDPDKLPTDQSTIRSIKMAGYYARQNKEQLFNSLSRSEGKELEDLCFLIANMPIRDVMTIKSNLLLENVKYARKALSEAPWKEKLDDELYREYILPYVNLTEKRETWRRKLYEECKLLVKGIDSPGEAAIRLNKEVFKKYKVKYHATKRAKPDQCISETLKSGYASCTGLSILLVNACRAVGIPARVVGVAEWTHSAGNHTWVEVWDQGWHCIGASESKALNAVWFKKGTASVDINNPLKRIYAAKFSRSTIKFPVVWSPYATYINAVDVSKDYIERFSDKK